jgi:PrtD family type I secretion system ABC transporter
MTTPTSTRLRAIITLLKPVAHGVGWISFFINLLILPMSIYSLQVMDRVMSTGSLPTLVWLTVIMLAMFAVAGALQALRSIILIQAADWLYERIAEIALPQVLAQAATGGKGAQHMRDASQLKQFISGNGLITLVDAPWAVLYIIGLFIIHAALGVLVTAGALLLIILAWINEVSMRTMVKDAGGAQMRGFQELELATRNAEVTEAMGMSRSLAARWKAMQKDATTLQQQAGSRSAVIQGITKFVRLALQVLVTCIAAYLAVHGSVTVGAIIASSILASRALAPFEVAISSWKSFTESRAAYGRLKEVFDHLPKDNAMPLPAPMGALSVDQASYVISGMERPILKSMTFALNRGESLGIIGPSGSGKSTLARLILGVYPLTSGAIRLDSADVHQWPKHELGKYIGYLPQDVELFGGTIKDNISRFQEDASPEAIVHAAQLASAHELILRLPQGYDTDIGASGAKLSAGQRQRIGLARALYGEPRLLILDEPDANLDEAGQQALLFALSTAKQRGITTLLITHRTSLLAHVDKLLLLREGTMEAFGPTAQVIAAINARQQAQRSVEKQP